MFVPFSSVYLQTVKLGSRNKYSELEEGYFQAINVARINVPSLLIFPLFVIKGDAMFAMFRCSLNE